MQLGSFFQGRHAFFFRPRGQILVHVHCMGAAGLVICVRDY
jgi:hypothetical protein